jgi:hypothetical protein
MTPQEHRFRCKALTHSEYYQWQGWVEPLKKLGIELRDGFGDKIQSSSWLIKKAKDN